ncbi:Glycine-rich domain-containing protein 1 [Turnera subulata]|uniref:Glycine-rich domain-containing protein 1 n=1 Tax=Turnera subulata TaxID=218843 RepID=A0A9Q0F215_9ROSI|nr:Glycine-rich domain-containing protein 1 [Turnera subulata]
MDVIDKMEAERETQQEIEWLEAQKIVISVDLLAAAKQQLKFLAAVDKNRCLYEGPALEKAIYRYATNVIVRSFMEGSWIILM